VKRGARLNKGATAVAPADLHTSRRPGSFNVTARICGGVILAVAAWLLPEGVRADAPLFVWADAQAHVHVTDRLANVPEPYRTTYAVRLEAMRQAGQAPGGPAGPVGVPPPRTAEVKFAGSGAERVAALSPQASQQAALRAQWQQRMVAARTELMGATDALQRLEASIDAARMNPVLRLTPPVQAQVEGLEAQRAQAQTRVLDARRMLLETLPQQAQREHIPPQWLM
jgi:hypothetical protein